MRRYSAKETYNLIWMRRVQCIWMQPCDVYEGGMAHMCAWERDSCVRIRISHTHGAGMSRTSRTHCKTLQHTHCKTLQYTVQHTATHTATHCNTQNVPHITYASLKSLSIYMGVHIWMQHGAYESLTYVTHVILSHICLSHICLSHICLSHICQHFNITVKTNHVTYEWVVSHIQVSHVTYGWAMSQENVSHVTYGWVIKNHPARHVHILKLTVKTTVQK